MHRVAARQQGTGLPTFLSTGCRRLNISALEGGGFAGSTGGTGAVVGAMRQDAD